MPRPTVRSARLGPVTRITLDRPQVRNAQDTQLILELDAAMRAAREDEAVMVHQFMHGTKTASDALAARARTGSMRGLIAERDRAWGSARAGAGKTSGASLSPGGARGKSRARWSGSRGAPEAFPAPARVVRRRGRARR